MCRNAATPNILHGLLDQRLCASICSGVGGELVGGNPAQTFRLTRAADSAIACA